MSFRMANEEFKKAQLVLNCQNGYLDLDNMQFVKAVNIEDQCITISDGETYEALASIVNTLTTFKSMLNEHALDNPKLSAELSNIKIPKIARFTAKQKPSNTSNTNINFPDAPDEAIQAEIAKYMESIFPDPEVCEYVLDSYAEKLDGVRRRCEELVIHIGSGANGKSVFNELIRKVFGTYCSYSTMTIENKIPQDARVINFSMQWPNKPIVNSSLKELLAGANYQLHTTYQIEMKPYMYMGTYECNQVKFDQVVDKALRRRVKVVPWTNRFTDDKQDHYIMDNFDKWAPQFLWLLFQRYKELKADNFKRLEKVPVAMTDATNWYLGCAL